MRRLTQTVLTDEAAGVTGNCVQTAVACVLDLPLDVVPHFSAFVWWPAAMELWARGRRLTVRTERTSIIPDHLCIVAGTSPRIGDHAVVGEAGGIVWDPHPSRDGLVNVTEVLWFEPWLVTAETKCWICRR